MVGSIVWFVAYNYFDKVEGIEFGNYKKEISVGRMYTLTDNGAKIESDGSNNSRSYHLIGTNNIKLPPTDVFIDLAKF